LSSNFPFKDIINIIKPISKNIGSAT
jgi:hypothetical protein